MIVAHRADTELFARIEAQIDAKLPTHKRMWAAIVRSKLEQQAAALAATGAPTAPLAALATQVKSGDPANLEAQGARRYWGLLFGEEFRRDQNPGGHPNSPTDGHPKLRHLS